MSLLHWFHYLKAPRDGKFGVIQGVYVPNVVQMIGVILFLRMSWILGHVGIGQMAAVITLSSSLLLLTSLSMGAIVSNMRMKAGGAYYLISRSLGIEFGSAIGVLQFVSQLCSVALCVTGFAISLSEMVPQGSLELFKIITLISLGLVAFFSTDLALKMQILIFVALAVSIGACFVGFQGIPEGMSQMSEHGSSLTFWAAFAMFFPATTGIESGMSMSGDLRNPSRALPLGTAASVITMYIVYLGLSLFLSQHVAPVYLRAHPFILYYTNAFRSLIMTGVWSATLSSALGALLGAPRVIQAIAKDGVLPQFLAQGVKRTNEPRKAMLVVFAMAFFLTLFTDINQIIPMLSMVCLISYTLINLVAFFEALLQNPSWRPTLKIPPWVPLFGSLGCFIAMFMINPGSTFLILSLVALLCLWISSRKVEGHWDDLRYSMISYFVNRGACKLSALGRDAKHWRPQILTFFEEGTFPKNLAFLAHALNQDKGLLTFATHTHLPDILPLKYEVQDNLKGCRITSHLHIGQEALPYTAASQMVEHYGFGHLRPNTIFLKVPTDVAQMEPFIAFVLQAHAREKNILILKDDPNKDFLFADPSRTGKQIQLWWRGKYPGNFELCLAIAFLLQQSRFWPQSKICIRMIVNKQELQGGLRQQFEKYRTRLRIKNLEFAPLIGSGGHFFDTFVTTSEQADLTFLGLKRPEGHCDQREYLRYFLELIGKTEPVSNIAYVLSGEKVKFRKIFL